LATVTTPVPAVATSPARIDAVSDEPLTTVVARVSPFQRTTAPLTNPLPVTARVNAPEPGATAVGETEVIVGVGLLTVNVTLFDGPPTGAGFLTATGTVPALARSLAGIVAVSWVAETNAV
jgi:hypothetical protein